MEDIIVSIVIISILVIALILILIKSLSLTNDAFNKKSIWFVRGIKNNDIIPVEFISVLCCADNQISLFNYRAHRMTWNNTKHKYCVENDGKHKKETRKK